MTNRLTKKETGEEIWIRIRSERALPHTIAYGVDTTMNHHVRTSRGSFSAVSTPTSATKHFKSANLYEKSLITCFTNTSSQNCTERCTRRSDGLELVLELSYSSQAKAACYSLQLSHETSICYRTYRFHLRGLGCSSFETKNVAACDNFSIHWTPPNLLGLKD